MTAVGKQSLNVVFPQLRMTGSRKRPPSVSSYYSTVEEWKLFTACCAHGCTHWGHTGRTFSHLSMHTRWKEWPHSPMMTSVKWLASS